MGDWDYYEDCYDHSVADGIFERAKEELKSALLEDAKQERERLEEKIKKLGEVNIRLQTQVGRMEKREKELNEREEYLEKDFYKKKISDLLEPVVTNMSAWGFDYEYMQVDKCNLCDEDRKIVWTSPQGEVRKDMCKCNQKYRHYYPVEATLRTITLKKDSWERLITVDGELKIYNDDYCGDIHIKEVNNSYNPDGKYGYWNSLFWNKEDCQKLCDRLNEEEQRKLKERMEVTK